VTRIVGRHERASALTVDEDPTVVALASVARWTQPVEVVELGLVDLDPWGAVVVLDRQRVGTASVGAPRGGPQQCDALRDGGAAAEVRDVEHVDAASDDDLEDRLTEQFAGPLDEQCGRTRR
jgi:hypothetical protein